MTISMPPRAISPQTARRLAIATQYLNRPRQPVDPAHMLDTVRQIGCVQLDPISAVARSHQLVLYSRLGPYELADIDYLLWQEKSLFEYWAHAASIVLTEDYPVHNAMMRAYPKGETVWGLRAARWAADNDALRQEIMNALRDRGPLALTDFEDRASSAWTSSGWTGGRNVSQMVDYLWTSGQIMVVGRKGLQKLWDLAERHFPDWTPRDVLEGDKLTERSAQKSLRALGVATSKHINLHYTRHRYPELNAVMKRLEADRRIIPVRIQGEGSDKAWPGAWYVHADDVPLLDRIEMGEWEPSTRLLSPFDNLIADRVRTEQLFNFRFRIEIYVPKAKREFGYYVLPILHGDRLIGRIDPTMNRKTGVLAINAVFAEPDAPTDAATVNVIGDSIHELATFLGAKAIEYTERVPDAWRKLAANA